MALLSVWARGSPQVRDGSGNPRAGLNAVDIKGEPRAPPSCTCRTSRCLADRSAFGRGRVRISLWATHLSCAVTLRPIRRLLYRDEVVALLWLHAAIARKGAYPIREGLAVATGIGVVFQPVPITSVFRQATASASARISGMSHRLLPSPTPRRHGSRKAQEFSTKIYLNNYFKNSVSDYKSGTLLDIEFAVSGHIGRWQIGVAGYYLRQLEDDRRAGVPVAPDGRRLQTMSLGGVFNYDMPEIGSSIKLKLRTSVFAYNAGMVSSFIISISKKIF